LTQGGKIKVKRPYGPSIGGAIMDWQLVIAGTLIFFFLVIPILFIFYLILGDLPSLFIGACRRRGKNKS
jgi:hypothetical protein